MAAVGLCPDYKVFAVPIRQDVSRQSTDSNGAFAHRLIDKSKSDENVDFWVPDVACDGILYNDSSIKEISDGLEEVRGWEVADLSLESALCGK
jgi:hypothetical protein